MDFLRVPGQILRKLSVFHLFAILLASSLGLYYWGIVPRNKVEVYSRVHRVLNLITGNLLKKDDNLAQLFNISIQNHSNYYFKRNVLLRIENFGPLDYLDYKAFVVKKPDSLSYRKNDTLFTGQIHTG